MGDFSGRRLVQGVDLEEGIAQLVYGEEMALEKGKSLWLGALGLLIEPQSEHLRVDLCIDLQDLRFPFIGKDFALLEHPPPLAERGSGLANRLCQGFG